MVNKSKILSDLSKIAVDAMSTFSSLRKEIETMVSLRVDKVINKIILLINRVKHYSYLIFHPKNQAYNEIYSL